VSKLGLDPAARGGAAIGRRITFRTSTRGSSAFPRLARWFRREPRALMSLLIVPAITGVERREQPTGPNRGRRIA